MNYFSCLIKPASSLCNMRCRYCFYFDEAQSRQVKSYGIMSQKTSENLINQIYAHVKAPAQVHFAFQGGEPTVAGLSYFNHFTAYAREHCPAGVKLAFAIQTNGLVIDEDWCRLFREFDFLVGISMDADRQTHDRNRLDASGKGTYNRIMASIRLMEKTGVAYNVLSVVTKQMARHPAAIFQAYLKNNIAFVQLIPCLSALDGSPSPHDLTPEGYAAFMKSFFSLWYEQLVAGNYFSIRQFDNLVAMAQGRRAEQCGMHGFCTPQFIVEADGGVYPCDFYVLDKYLCGNVNENTVLEIGQSEGMKRFLQDDVQKNPLCANCPVLGLCGGGCKRYRSFYNQKPGYCPYQDFLVASQDKILHLAHLYRQR